MWKYFSLRGSQIKAEGDSFQWTERICKLLEWVIHDGWSLEKNPKKLDQAATETGSDKENQAKDRQAWQDAHLGRCGIHKGSNASPSLTSTNHVASHWLLTFFEFPLTQGDTDTCLIAAVGLRGLNGWACLGRPKDPQTAWHQTACPPSVLRPRPCLNMSGSLACRYKRVLNDLYLYKPATPKRLHVLLEALWSRTKVTGPKLEGFQFGLRIRTFYPGQCSSFHTALYDDFRPFSKLDQCLEKLWPLSVVWPWQNY